MKKVLVPQQMGQAETRYIVTVLYTILIVALLTMGAALIAGLLNGHLRTSTIVSIVFMACAGMLWLTWRGRLTLPRIVLPLVAFVMTTLLVSGDKGIHDEAIFGYALTLALAGLLLGKRGVIMYGVLGLAALAGLTWAEINGLLATDYDNKTTWISLVYSAMTFGFTAVLLYIIMDNLGTSLAQARRNAQELAESNASLETMRASLEDRVAERTASAETARQAAEAARRAVETEAWQTTGLVQLDEALRGEQDLSRLAGRAIQHLCHYLNARVGALYVKQDRALYLAGSYACAPGTTRLDPGQGLPGQVVRDGQPILVRDLPAGYLPITSGLGEMSPRQLAIWPLAYEGQVLGVVELGLADDLPAAGRQFLDRAAVGVAIALHTAQSRARINDLLTKTQAQANDLALQREELLAMNEEMQAQSESLTESV